VIKRSILFILVACYLLNAQNYQNDISGHVYDQLTGKPLAQVNVYIANTTWGMSTDKQGYYIIKSLPPGIHELVVSMAGYQYSSKPILVKIDSHLQSDFHLAPVAYETEPTVVMGEIPKGWVDDLQKFKHYFLGQSARAGQCNIENPEVLDFEWTSSNYMTARAIQPLRIMNNALGLQIDCILVHFYWDGKNNKWSWSIKPKFSYLQPADTIQFELWKRNRLSANIGSPFHFFRSLLLTRLHEEGYVVYFVDDLDSPSSGNSFQFISDDYRTLLKPGAAADEWKLGFRKYLYIQDDQGRFSWLKLNYPEITLDSFGYPVEFNAIEVYGYWATMGVADLLPRYEEYR
jgi:hypothetical protein